MRHFENSKVIKSSNANIKPFVVNSYKKIDQNEIKEILDKYYRRRFKEKAESGTGEIEEAKENNQESRDLENNDQEGSEEKKVQKEEVSESTPLKFIPMSAKRNSQKPGDSPKKLDENTQNKRPASDDDKGASSDEEKKQQKNDQNIISKNKVKIQLKNICRTSRDKAQV